MKIVIDMPEEKYEWIKKNNPNADTNSIVGAIANGTPLPKGHGDLIDRDKAYDVLDNAGLSLNCSGLLRYVSTVIPADKGMCFNCQYKTDSCQEGLHCIRDYKGE